MAERYLYPPRPTEAVPFEAALDTYRGKSSWVGQYKFNDSRSLIWFRAGQRKVEIWGRRKSLADYDLSVSLADELWSIYDRLSKPGEWLALDGGLLHTRHPCPFLKNKFVIYDVLALNGKTLLGTTYLERQKLIQDLLPKEVKSAAIPLKDGVAGEPVDVGYWLTENVFTPFNIPFGEWELAWSEVQRVNEGWLTGHGNLSPVLEGLVMKDVNGKLEPMIKEVNNGHWMCRSRVETGRHAY